MNSVTIGFYVARDFLLRRASIMMAPISLTNSAKAAGIKSSRFVNWASGTVYVIRGILVIAIEL